ncbi:MAG: hypothetical protein ACREKH_12155 [Candidatus Rokuibacteriota bacterium]
MRNPWARLPYAGLLDRFPRLRAGTDEIDGESLGDLFGLPPGWPE